MFHVAPPLSGPISFDAAKDKLSRGSQLFEFLAI
jgi:hypothetical protein